MKVNPTVVKLKELVDVFTEDVEGIKKATALNEVSALERKCIQEMWAIQSVAGGVGNDLKLAVATARKRIKNGAIVKQEEAIKEIVEEPPKEEEVAPTPVSEPAEPEKKPRRRIIRRKTKKASK